MKYFHLLTVLLWALAAAGVAPLSTAPWWALTLPSLVPMGIGAGLLTVAGTIYLFALVLTLFDKRKRT